MHHYSPLLDVPHCHHVLNLHHPDRVPLVLNHYFPNLLNHVIKLLTARTTHIALAHVKLAEYIFENK